MQAGVALLHYTFQAVDVLDKEGFFENAKKNDKASFLDISLLRKKKSWWNSWGRCTASIAGGVLVAAGTIAAGPVGWAALATWSSATIITGAGLTGAAAGC